MKTVTTYIEIEEINHNKHREERQQGYEIRLLYCTTSGGEQLRRVCVHDKEHISNKNRRHDNFKKQRNMVD